MPLLYNATTQSTRQEIKIKFHKDAHYTAAVVGEMASSWPNWIYSRVFWNMYEATVLHQGAFVCGFQNGLKFFLMQHFFASLVNPIKYLLPSLRQQMRRCPFQECIQSSLPIEWVKGWGLSIWLCGIILEAVLKFYEPFLCDLFLMSTCNYGLTF